MSAITGISLIVFVIVLSFAVGMNDYYHSAVLTGIENKAQTATGFFTYNISKTYLEYYQSAYRYTETFEDKDTLELQFINNRGTVEVSSYGISAGTSPGTPEIEQALKAGKMSSWYGESGVTNERIMTVSAPILHSDGSTVGIMRYVTSLKLVDEQVRTLTLISLGVGFFIILIVFLFNIYFINTIIEPIQGLTKLSKQIAKGSYGIHSEKKYKYDDEIGELTDTINEMSTKINQADKTQTEFISSVSHELRTPLTAIKGWSETLLSDPEISGDSQRGLQIISQEAGRLGKMVEELLEFTKIQDGRFNLNMEQIDIEAELEDTMFAYSELLKQDNISLDYSPVGTPIPLMPGDSGRLRQVFMNILDNAAKYGKSGGLIEVKVERQVDEVVISVRDHGPGIPEGELPFVKNKFYKGSSKERGSGIGLAVCDEIVSRHEGRLIVKNADGGGVVVRVRLPIKQPQA